MATRSRSASRETTFAQALRQHLDGLGRELLPNVIALAVAGPVSTRLRRRSSWALGSALHRPRYSRRPRRDHHDSPCRHRVWSLLSGAFPWPPGATRHRGGHIGFAPQGYAEMKILEALARRFGRVSVERMLSGPGLENLAQALNEMTQRCSAHSSHRGKRITGRLTSGFYRKRCVR